MRKAEEKTFVIEQNGMVGGRWGTELLLLHDKVVNLLKYQDNRLATGVMYVVVLHMEII